MKQLNNSDLRALIQMKDGATIASSTISKSLASELLSEGILMPIANGSRTKFRAANAKSLEMYIAQRYNVTDMSAFLEAKSASTRAQQVYFGGESKIHNVRTFRGFLVNSYEPIYATLGGQPFVIEPPEGSSVFVSNFETFKIPSEVTVVGIENGENFHCIRSQRYLFQNITPLFVSRYPQSTDIREWLMRIENPYIHFGDFDLAGICIYQREIFAHVGRRASFFVPYDIENRLANGNRVLYDKQYSRYHDMQIDDERVQPLVEMIHRHKRVYEQEGYIQH